MPEGSLGEGAFQHLESRVRQGARGQGAVTAEQPARAPWSGLEGRGQEDLEKKQVC